MFNLESNRTWENLKIAEELVRRRGLSQRVRVLGINQLALRREITIRKVLARYCFLPALNRYALRDNLEHHVTGEALHKLHIEGFEGQGGLRRFLDAIHARGIGAKL